MEGDYENPWYYKGTAFTSDDIGDFFGYVYLITNKTTGKNTSVENTSCRRENQKEENDVLLLSLIGRNIMDPLPNSNPTYPPMERKIFPERYCHFIPLLGKVNYEETRQLFLNNVLTESLDDGTPMYYNSNILGRYMKKDYGNFARNIKIRLMNGL